MAADNFGDRLRRRRAGDLHVEPDEPRLYRDAVRASELGLHLRRQVREGVLRRDGRVAGGRAVRCSTPTGSSSSAPACSAFPRSSSASCSRAFNAPTPKTGVIRVPVHESCRARHHLRRRPRLRPRRSEGRRVRQARRPCAAARPARARRPGPVSRRRSSCTAAGSTAAAAPRTWRRRSSRSPTPGSPGSASTTGWRRSSAFPRREKTSTPRSSG